MDVTELYNYADENKINVHSYPLTELKSLSVPNHIAIDKSKIENSTEEKVCIAHEIGHCETGSFYSNRTKLDVRERHENRANRWAVHALIPIDEYKIAIQDGYTEVWQLADYFEVTEDFIKKAIYIYKCEGEL